MHQTEILNAGTTHDHLQPIWGLYPGSYCMVQPIQTFFHGSGKTRAAPFLLTVTLAQGEY
jgi:hypothetical protein